MSQKGPLRFAHNTANL